MPSNGPNDRDSLRNRLIGLGERSVAKSYYPELQKRLDDLERFRAVVNHANDAIFVFATEGWRVADVNETALVLLGLERQEALGAHISDFFLPEIAARYANALPEDNHITFRNGHIVTWLNGKDGRRTPIEITVTVHRFAGTGYAVVVARDVTMRQQMEAELDKSRRLFASFMEHSPAMAAIKDLEGHYIFANPAFAACVERTPQDIIGCTDNDLWAPEVAENLRENDQFVLEQKKPLFILEHTRLLRGGLPRYLQVSKFPLVQNGVTFAVAAIAVDISVQIQTEQALQHSEERYRIVAEYNHDMECWLSPTGQMLYISPSCERITGYPTEHYLADPKALEKLIHTEDLETWRHFHSAVLSQENDALDFRITRQDGSVRWVNEVKREVMGGNGGSMGSRISLRDITDRKRMELELRHLALHDPLTGLANRSLCLDRIRQAMARARRRQPYYFALVFLDLDRFKILNDSLGHSFGDRVLIAVAETLQDCVRGLDTVSRFGGDEFVILLEELNTPREAVQAIQRIRQSLSQPFSVDGHEVQLTASLGLTLGSQDADTPEDLLRNANVAMHQAKKAGRNRFKSFTNAMLDRASKLLHLETDLRRAIAKNEFFLVFQPIVRLDKTAGLHGFEALIRWNHPERGLISPAEFIPVAEETGLIVEIGKYVLLTACTTLKAWRDANTDISGVVMSVNLSPRQFSDSSLVESVTSILSETGLPPQALKLEITETAIMDNASTAVDRLRRLKSLGIALSIDDFGTGYSSMSSLQQFPLDTLKIDLGFIRRMNASLEGLEIVKAIISLAHTLRLQVVAEGVEREDQRDVLTELGCEFAQGYLYAKPLPQSLAWEYLLSCHEGCPQAEG